MNTSYKKSVFKTALKVTGLTYQIGETDLLRKKSEKVKTAEIESKKIQSTISKLKKTLLEYKKLTGKGKGIAAVQIGIPLRIAVLFINDDLVTIINPKIVKKSKKLLAHPEICMSANPIIAKVIRPAWVKVEYSDQEGKKQIWDNPKDLILGRVLQHEIDHMDGIINIDLVKAGELILDSDPLFLKNAKFDEVRNN